MFETRQSVHYVVVAASDGDEGEGVGSATATVTVLVQDAPDEVPLFTVGEYSAKGLTINALFLQTSVFTKVCLLCCVSVIPSRTIMRVERSPGKNSVLVSSDKVP